MIIKVLDILSAIGTVVCLNLTSRTYKAWFYYIFASIAFTIVCFNRQLPGLTIMGVVLIGTGAKNYIVGRKKNEREK